MSSPRQRSSSKAQAGMSTITQNRARSLLPRMVQRASQTANLRALRKASPIAATTLEAASRLRRIRRPPHPRTTLRAVVPRPLPPAAQAPAKASSFRHSSGLTTISVCWNTRLPSRKMPCNPGWKACRHAPQSSRFSGRRRKVSPTFRKLRT